MDDRLVCPECESKVTWDGRQHLCPSCPWTEHRARPPSERNIKPAEGAAATDPVAE